MCWTFSRRIYFDRLKIYNVHWLHDLRLIIHHISNWYSWKSYLVFFSYLLRMLPDHDYHCSHFSQSVPSILIILSICAQVCSVLIMMYPMLLLVVLMHKKTTQLANQINLDEKKEYKNVSFLYRLPKGLINNDDDHYSPFFFKSNAITLQRKRILLLLITWE